MSEDFSPGLELDEPDCLMDPDCLSLFSPLTLLQPPFAHNSPPAYSLAQENPWSLMNSRRSWEFPLTPPPEDSMFENDLRNSQSSLSLAR